LKAAIHKSEIPPTQIFVIRELEENHFDPTWHAHSEYQLFVVLEGRGTRFVGDSIRSFSEGELVLTGPHLPHLWRSEETYFEKHSNLKTKGIVVYFNENFLGDHILDKEEMIMIKKLFARSMRGLEFFGKKKEEVVRMLKELASMRGLESVIHLLKILHILGGCREYRYISNTSYENPFKESETDRMNKVYDYVLKNFKKKLSLAELAELLHMTPTSFSRYFTIKNNKSFSRFVSEIRIKHACKMLAATDQSISSICYDSGFNTLSNFNRQFKEVMLKKPMEYKKELRTWI
jgi:AraC-like DNA-binding protein